jgi:excisionase family DNA binding protein
MSRRSAAATLDKPMPLPRRGLRLEEAAAWVGIGRTKFVAMVEDGRMPAPRKIDGAKVWDVRELDVAFDDLPRDGEGNGWDAYHGQGDV